MSFPSYPHLCLISVIVLNAQEKQYVSSIPKTRAFLAVSLRTKTQILASCVAQPGRLTAQLWAQTADSLWAYSGSRTGSEAAEFYLSNECRLLGEGIMEVGGDACLQLHLPSSTQLEGLNTWSRRSWPKIRTVCAHHLNGRITEKAKRKASRWFLLTVWTPNHPVLSSQKYGSTWVMWYDPCPGHRSSWVCDVLRSLPPIWSLTATALATYECPEALPSKGQGWVINMVTVSAGPLNLGKHI